MSNTLRIGIVALAFCVSSASAQLQVTKSAGFLRTAIETYPEDERRPILDYLDAARGVADRAAGQLASGHGEDVFREVEATAKATGQQIDTREAAGLIEGLYGAVISYEYRAQAIEAFGAKPEVHDLAHATSAVFYAVRTTKRPDGDLFLAIKTVRIGGVHNVFFINFTDYIGKVPPWLQPRSSAPDGGGCAAPPN